MSLIKKGFTLIELLVTVAIMLIVLSAVYMTYISVLKGYKKEAGIGSKTIEEQIGLELIRKDILLAGIGIPITTQPISISGANDNYTLTLLMTNSASSDKTQGYVLMSYDSIGKKFNLIQDNRVDNTVNNIVVLGTDKQFYTKGVLQNGTPKYISYDCSTITNNTVAFGFPLKDSTSNYETVTYDLAASNLARCFSGASNLVRNGMPIVNCVKGFKVYFGYDNNSDGTIDDYCENSICSAINGATNMYTKLKSISVFILTHDGGKDNNFNYGSTSVSYQDTETGKTITFTNLNNVPDYNRYRWKIIKVSGKTVNIRGTSYE
ncbi:PilW family protein [Calditerrivibrio nitroreducens]|uniref:Prepilin-type N-terminal cleavage/methylation domain-containing protein n=1 Tax=Calditerrivibrio nitroreducens (strain DSM 19672 / NBRC 101217 / Yu37-1) TaxID=768670 RepID=E4TJ40_CALNY|nr:prepilin-type N-terminal cleavage/methylation domain-containing protein [Calditerrivibrio nitroreducens]ADR18076.1 hypothetical protein Calni_0163 [Calditerrivibrio nitroreducens DSM 19672]